MIINDDAKNYIYNASITSCSILIIYVTNPIQIHDFMNILLNFLILYVFLNANINTNTIIKSLGVINTLIKLI